MLRTISLIAALSLCHNGLSAELSAHQLVFYRENGYLVQQGFFRGAELRDLEQHIQIALDSVSELPWEGSHTEEKLFSKGTLFVLGPVGSNGLPVIKRMVWAGARFPELLAYGRHPKLKKNVSFILDSPRASHLINQIHPKQPDDGVEYDVHRDIDNRRSFDKNWQDIKGNGSFVQTMAAIDPMGEYNGGLYVVPRSHHDCSPMKGNTTLSEEYRQEKHGEVIPVVMNAGDMLYVHPCLVHFSGPNTSDKPRRLFINGYAFPGANNEPYPGDGSGEEVTLID
ncbi:phytanoyl-CoA dioxygenase family protein [Endozoicomonas sp.]|uniref:phytanoyl-CoA dioxygenase family protein n=1 Tax=Endozoicomonas sp. TaxID=1892382 RepID=UPI003AF7B20E